MIARGSRDVEQIRLLVEDRLKERRRSLGFGLKVVHVVEEGDGWLCFVVEPSRKSVRAYDYAKALSDVEVELRKEGIGDIFLVPAMPE